MYMKFFLQKKQYTKGFTLLETLIAVTILVTALVGPMTIASNGLNSAFFARDQVTAFYLAQEGIEFVRYVRDTNTLRNQPLADGDKKDWLFGLGVCTQDLTNVNDPEKKCELDVRNSAPTNEPDNNRLNIAVIACSELAGCDPLKYDDPNTGSGMFQYATGNNSRFTREVSITKLSGNPNQALVESTIHWSTGRISKDFTLKELITNWQQ